MLGFSCPPDAERVSADPESTTASPSDTAVDSIIYIGAGGGALLLIIIAVAVCAIRKRKAKQTGMKETRETGSSSFQAPSLCVMASCVGRAGAELTTSSSTELTAAV